MSTFASSAQIPRFYCPTCSKHFDTESNLSRHRNHRLSPCYGKKVKRVDAPFIDETPSQDLDMDTRKESIDFSNLSCSPSLTSFLTVNHPSPPVTVEGGLSFMDNFDQDTHSKCRDDWPFYPFASRMEWELACHLSTSGMSLNKIDEQLKLECV